MKRGPKPIPKIGLFARYVTLGKNDYGTQTVSESFPDAPSLIEALLRADENMDVEAPAKVYLNGQLIFNGDGCDARFAPEILALLPSGWKSSRQLREEARKERVNALAAGMRLQTAHVYNGDLLWADPSHKLHRQRPNEILEKQFVDPVTISFYRERLEYQFPRPVWTVVEASELELEKRPTGKKYVECKIPHAVYVAKGFEANVGDAWWIEEDGKNLYRGWAD